MIWSNETFLGNDAIVFPAVQRLTEAGVGALRIVAYVRRPDAWAQSAYLQWGIKHKTTPARCGRFATGSPVATRACAPKP